LATQTWQEDALMTNNAWKAIVYKRCEYMEIFKPFSYGNVIQNGQRGKRND
jgi:hypothetical protein